MLESMRPTADESKTSNQEGGKLLSGGSSPSDMIHRNTSDWLLSNIAGLGIREAQSASEITHGIYQGIKAALPDTWNHHCLDFSIVPKGEEPVKWHIDSTVSGECGLSESNKTATIGQEYFILLPLHGSGTLFCDLVVPNSRFDDHIEGGSEYGESSEIRSAQLGEEVVKSGCRIESPRVGQAAILKAGEYGAVHSAPEPGEGRVLMTISDIYFTESASTSSDQCAGEVHQDADPEL